MAAQARAREPQRDPARTVLLVEDDVDIASAVRELLSLDGFDVVWVETEAAARAALSDGGYALVILDWMLRGGDTSRTLLADLAAVDPSRVVVCSATREARLAAERAGVSFLGKPFEAADLLDHVIRASREVTR